MALIDTLKYDDEDEYDYDERYQSDEYENLDDEDDKEVLSIDPDDMCEKCYDNYEQLTPDFTRNDLCKHCRTINDDNARTLGR